MAESTRNDWRIEPNRFDPPPENQNVYAIIADGAHQYRVEEGQEFEIQRKEMDSGATLEFDRVLFLGGADEGPHVGRPVVEGAKVTATVLCEIKGDKLVIQKHRPRKNYRLKKGHRQKFLRVKVTEISISQ